MYLPTESTTEILLRLGAGDRDAADDLTQRVYQELHELAERLMAAERPDHTLQPTALVHEAYLKLVDQTRVDWKSRAQFCGVAAQIMRRLLVDHARAHKALRRGGGDRSSMVTDSIAGSDDTPPIDLLALDEALDELDRLNRRHRQVVETRFFGGLTVEESAWVLGVSPQTVLLDWKMAKAWLRQRLVV